jgi:hypothetical protein
MSNINLLQFNTTGVITLSAEKIIPQPGVWKSEYIFENYATQIPLPLFQFLR